MIECRVQVVHQGEPDAPEHVRASLTIRGDGRQGSLGNYTWTMRRHARDGQAVVISEGTVSDYKRSRGYWPLVRQIIEAAGDEAEG